MTLISKQPSSKLDKNQFQMGHSAMSPLPTACSASLCFVPTSSKYLSQICHSGVVSPQEFLGLYEKTAGQKNAFQMLLLLYLTHHTDAKLEIRPFTAIFQMLAYPKYRPIYVRNVIKVEKFGYLKDISFIKDHVIYLQKLPLKFYNCRPQILQCKLGPHPKFFRIVL